MKRRATLPLGWSHAGTCVEGERFEIQGVNVWDHEWTPMRPEEYATVKDPTYGQDYDFTVCEIVVGSQRIVFAAGEFSNSVWGFYVRDRVVDR